MLTRKQRDLLYFIQSRVKDDDVAPSFDEMREALGLKSKSGIHRLISALEERGYLERLPHRARAIRLKKLTNTPSLKAVSSPKLKAPEKTHDSFSHIPMYGKIAAGTPIEAIRDEGTTVPVPAAMVAAKDDHYALTVDGNSMVEAGIHDGDTVVIKRCDTASDGAIVVALVDGEEVTLKTLKRKGKEVILVPHSADHAPQKLSADRVQIQGTLAALLRSYH